MLNFSVGQLVTIQPVGIIGTVRAVHIDYSGELYQVQYVDGDGCTQLRYINAEELSAQRGKERRPRPVLAAQTTTTPDGRPDGIARAADAPETQHGALRALQHDAAVAGEH